MKFSKLKIGDKFYDKNDVGPYVKLDNKSARLEGWGSSTFYHNETVYLVNSTKPSGKRYKSVKDLKAGRPHVVTKQYRRLNPEEKIKRGDYTGDNQAKNLLEIGQRFWGMKVCQNTIWREVY